MRSVLEYSSPVYHSQLNGKLNNLLEKVQKQALKIIFGYQKTYEELLEEAGMEKLEVRRQKAFGKFAEKSLQNEKYSSRWFPKRELVRLNRHTSPYLEEKAQGSRLYNSPLFAMRRFLNGTRSVEEIDLSGLFVEV